MTFSCPHYDDATRRCRLLKTLCVPGRPGCVQEDTATFALDLETRIRMAEAQEARRIEADRRRPK